VGAVFCADCGIRVASGAQPVVSLPVIRAQAAWRRVRAAAFCYLALLATVLGVALADSGERTLELYVGADVVMLVVVSAFAWPVRRELSVLFRPPRMDVHAWALFLLGPAVLWLLNQGLIATTRDLPGVLISDPAIDLRLAGASTITVILLCCVTPALLEEVAFRGIILEQIRESFGTPPAAIVVSILFSILHLALLSFIPFAALALVFAMLRLRTGSLWPPIVGHFLFNLASVVLA
jgi:membrane protease YdiL (CAAX protease family)